MIDVTCAIIRNEDNQVLVVQRGELTDHPMKWEFPGGKQVPGETEEECIIREIREELSIEIVICDRLPQVEHDYGNKKIRLIPFVCDTLDDMPFLTEHVAFKWIDVKELMTPDYSEADIIVAKNYLDSIESEKISTAKTNALPQDKLSENTDLQQIVNSMMSMAEAEWIAASAIDNPAVFNKLFEYSLSSDKRLAFRASWTLSKVCDRFPEIIYPYLEQIVANLNELDYESTLRSFLRIISLSDLTRINARQQGLLTDLCFNKLNSGFSAIAVKAYSMEILYKLSLIYPGLANELFTSITVLMEDGSAGITSRGRAILRKLGGKPVKPKPGQQEL